MSSESRVDRAIETYDHLLWEAVARVCGRAFSKAFNKVGQSVRVVYETDIDPRQCFGRIKEEIESLILKGLPIEKEQPGDGWMRELEEACSRKEYWQYFTSSQHWEYPWEVVKIGFPRSEAWKIFPKLQDWICCPCKGQHLQNTSELKNFNIELKEPKRVGQDRYEFRFSLTN